MRRSLVFAIIATAGAAGTALAGAKNADPVFINPTQRQAMGGLGSARNSTDSSQWCFTSDPGMIQAAYAIKGDSFLRFGWDASNRCTHLSVINDSSMEPKKP